MFTIDKSLPRGPDVILNTKTHDKFCLNICSPTQSMHQRENTKIKLITLKKKIK